VSDYLPSRFKPTNVDRFLPVLKSVLSGKPEIRFKHDELQLGPGTATARVRDAALAVIRGVVFYPEIDADKLRDVWWHYKVTYDHLTREVVVGLKHREESVPDQNFLDAVIRVDDTDLEGFRIDLAAFAHLYSRRRMMGRLTILGMLDDEIKRELELKYNVMFNPDGPNRHVML
jgi:hypothetical protein